MKIKFPKTPLHRRRKKPKDGTRWRLADIYEILVLTSRMEWGLQNAYLKKVGASTAGLLGWRKKWGLEGEALKDRFDFSRREL